MEREDRWYGTQWADNGRARWIDRDGSTVVRRLCGGARKYRIIFRSAGDRTSGGGGGTPRTRNTCTIYEAARKDVYLGAGQVIREALRYYARGTNGGDGREKRERDQSETRAKQQRGARGRKSPRQLDELPGSTFHSSNEKITKDVSLQWGLRYLSRLSPTPSSSEFFFIRLPMTIYGGQ